MNCGKAARNKWIPFTFSRRHRQRRRDPDGEGQSRSVEGQIQGHNDLEMTLNDWNYPSWQRDVLPETPL